MYIVEVTGEIVHTSREHVRCVVKTHKLGTIKDMLLTAGNHKMILAEKEYTHKSYAIKMAARIANAGYVVIDNPELWIWQRYFPVNSVRVYDNENPDIDIDF